jgi:hypothetical protein
MAFLRLTGVSLPGGDSNEFSSDFCRMHHRNILVAHDYISVRPTVVERATPGHLDAALVGTEKG